MNKAILHTAVDLLSRREHSIKELKNKLLLRDYPPEDFDEIIDYLLEKNYLSNERFADSVIRQRINKGYGWRFIENELKQKGLDTTTIMLAKQELSIDWYQQAETAYHKRFGKSSVIDNKDKAKRIRFLQYRGFSSDEIMQAIKTEV
ncbi:regulatory protein RecX [Thalassotalea profundi]|uniref:Regulatory protein RecX n=1 Tax=Thalassotalea profundi TaxID=2036687 RepID=A0ABQ3IKF5_9GAMM|nr:regulatory protein RecX [Thalassotalea profundi]GHE87149.1 regulatory protein RecX [Thalassotalea profundi]